jgi:hypothetical protein
MGGGAEVMCTALILWTSLLASFDYDVQLYVVVIRLPCSGFKLSSNTQLSVIGYTISTRKNAHPREDIFAYDLI